MMNEAQFQHAVGDWSSPLPVPRMRIYRNNVVGALTAALEVRYPVTAQLVGQEFFVAMAAGFAEGNRPTSPVLIDYGAGFPDFIASFPPASGVPYLADVARLESLWWQAYHAADEAPLDPASLSAVDPEHWGALVFRPHPSLGLLRSVHPAGSIWSAHHGGISWAEAIKRPCECIVVSRPAAEVSVRIVGEASMAFLERIVAGIPLAEAVEQVQEQHMDLDLGSELSALLSHGFTAGLA